MSDDVMRAIRRRQARRRERIATAVLAGMHANSDPRMVAADGHDLARFAVEAADALLDHLAAAESRDSLRDHERSSRAESEVTA